MPATAVRHDHPFPRLTAAVASALILGGVLGGCGSAASAQPKASPSPRVAAAQWLRHIDETAGFSLDYPASWNVYGSRDPGVQFLVGPDDADFVLVRVIAPLPVCIGPGQTQAMKQITDGLLLNQKVEILREAQVSLAGLPGWEYVYSFADSVTKGTGVHIHVFLFQGNRLHTLVLQVLPQTRLHDLAPTFDQVLARFRTMPVAQTAPQSTPCPGVPQAPSPTGQ
jgi:hypothetical protein